MRAVAEMEEEMTREEAIAELNTFKISAKSELGENALDMAIEALEQDTCEMTAEEYRQRMIQAFHNAGTEELIALCVLPTEKEFEHLEWLLKNHYKKESCEDCISRESIKQKLQELICGLLLGGGR